MRERRKNKWDQNTFPKKVPFGWKKALTEPTSHQHHRASLQSLQEKVPWFSLAKQESKAAITFFSLLMPFFLLFLKLTALLLLRYCCWKFKQYGEVRVRALNYDLLSRPAFEGVNSQGGTERKILFICLILLKTKSNGYVWDTFLNLIFARTFNIK